MSFEAQPTNLGLPRSFAEFTLERSEGFRMTISMNDLKKSGFVVLVGRSNVGKSTLLNALIGTKVSITTPKPQTTRLPVQGILTEDRGQIVFVDTPGIFHDAKDLLTKRLNELVAQALHGVDLILYVVDPTRAIGNEEHQLLRMIEKFPKEKKILVINKLDLTEKSFEFEYLRLAEQFAKVLNISALEGKGLKELKEAAFEALPEGEPYFPEFQFATISNKDWIAEIIREKVFMALHQELPYSVHVVVDEVKEEKGLMHVYGRIQTTEDRYKGMIVGARGAKIKEIGMAARQELEIAMNRKIFLKLEVEVEPDWQRAFESRLG